MVNRLIVGALLAGLACPLVSVVQAADENMDSSVYLTFDPATGQFTSATKNISESNQFVDTGVQPDQAAVANDAAPAVTATAAPAAEPAPTTTAVQEQAGPAEAGTEPSIIIIAGVLALVVFAGIGYLMRKGQSGSTA
jgi:hypothetical protein